MNPSRVCAYWIQHGTGRSRAAKIHVLSMTQIVSVLECCFWKDQSGFWEGEVILCVCLCVRANWSLVRYFKYTTVILKTSKLKEDKLAKEFPAAKKPKTPSLDQKKTRCSLPITQFCIKKWNRDDKKKTNRGLAGWKVRNCEELNELRLLTMQSHWVVSGL
jgi:hypothetical protein